MAKRQGPVARYDEWADWYESYVTADAQAFTEEVAQVLARVLGPGTGPPLDLACGTGVYASVLSGLGWAPLGLDVSSGQLRYARARLPVILADAALPPLRRQSLQAVASVMCHTDIDDYAAVLRALSPALTGGGVFAHVGVHPCYIGPFADRADPEAISITPGYWNTERSFEAWSPRGVRARVGAVHVPLAGLLNAFTSAGLVIEHVVEAGGPTPDVLGVRCRRDYEPR
jgi:SAM-dependent methyltransferase